MNPLLPSPLRISSSPLFFSVALPLLLLLLQAQPCRSSMQSLRITPGFQGSQMNWIDNDGLFLLSNSSDFAFGFRPPSPSESTSFLLVVFHQPSSRVVWTANGGSPVANNDRFAFGDDGNVFLESGSDTVWSTNTSGRGAAAMVLLDSGNLVLLGPDGGGGSPLWQSFSHPTDTLLSGQNFSQGMRLVSMPNDHNRTFHLAVGSGDVRLYADFRSPQPYWSVPQEKRAVKIGLGGGIFSAVLVGRSWKFYDQSKSLLWQFIVSDSTSSGADNTTLAAVLGSGGFISFYRLLRGQGSPPEQTKIPQDPCDTPEYCGPYYICSRDTSCQCPPVLAPDCQPPAVPPCGVDGGGPIELAKVGDGVGYFATGFVQPVLRSSLAGCRDACLGNCSCLALFFDQNSGGCFMFDEIGSLRQLAGSSSGGGFASYVKVPGRVGSGGGSNHVAVVVVVISLATVAVIAAVIYLAVRFRRRGRGLPEPSQQGSSDEDNFLENLAGMPVRYSYRELQEATNNFSVKLGQGGFGSVYLGTLPDGSRMAVKQLEGIGQGKKEFRAEVSIIGSIHHVHLVRLRGFCAEGTHRLLAYEYMAKGSLDRWIFRRHGGGGDGEGGGGGAGQQLLDWDKRFNIALCTAKGLAYLHEDCDSKIVHCDIKPENVLLDDNFLAKVSDFGLAKLMTREQSHVFTTLRGTRGYLAPEWITNYAISEKSDVYSFGMVLLEIIGGRKNFDTAETSERAHFPSYAFRKMEEGVLREVLDPRLRSSAGKEEEEEEEDGRVETAIKVALWCIQEDMSLRPSMTKVVQMLEGLTDVPQPPTSSQMGFRLYANVFKSLGSEGRATTSSSGPSDCNSDAFLSAVRLSGPR